MERLWSQLAPRKQGSDFIRIHDLLFRQVYAFFIVHLASRRVVHFAATCHATQATPDSNHRA